MLFARRSIFLVGTDARAIRPRLLPKYSATIGGRERRGLTAQNGGQLLRLAHVCEQATSVKCSYKLSTCNLNLSSLVYTPSVRRSLGGNPNVELEHAHLYRECANRWFALAFLTFNFQILTR